MTMVKRGIWCRVVLYRTAASFPNQRYGKALSYGEWLPRRIRSRSPSADTRESERYLIRSVEEIDKEIINDADMSWTIQNQRKRTYSSPQILALKRLGGFWFVRPERLVFTELWHGTNQVLNCDGQSHGYDSISGTKIGQMVREMSHLLQNCRDIRRGRI